jgi:hypothetical protein
MSELYHERAAGAVVEPDMARGARSSNRRHFGVQLLGSLATWGLLQRAIPLRALARAASPVDGWLRELHARCRDLGETTITPVEWQEAVEALQRRIPLDDLLAAIDFDQLVRGLRYRADIGVIKEVHLPRLRGLPARRFASKLFCYQRGAATPPHAHNNVASVHLVVRGTVRTRTYDRVRDGSRALILRPTRDLEAAPGTAISMSDDRDNAHWFVATSRHAFTFDVVMSDVVAGKSYSTPAEAFGQIFLDPTAAPDRSGAISAPIIPFRQALSRFGGR